MPPSNRRLVHRSNVAVSNEPSQLPAYQKPQRALNAKAKRDLQSLSAYDYQKHHKLLQDGLNYLANAVLEVSDLLEEQKVELRDCVKKREKEEGEKADFEVKMEDSVRQVEARLEELFVKGEKAVRHLLDLVVQNRQQSNVVEQVLTAIVNTPAPVPRQDAQEDGNPNANSEAQDEDKDDDEHLRPRVRPIELFYEARSEQKAGYEAQSLRDRYATMKPYKQFREAVHQAQHGKDGETPMPPVSKWFTQDGPNLGQSQQDDDADDSNDELVVQSASINTKCPLTLMDLTEPLSNSNCVHCYQKASLLEYIQTTGRIGLNGQKQVQCVVPGCNNVISAEICRVDPIVVRKVKKALAEAKRLEEEDEEDDEEDEEGMLLPHRARSVRS